MAIKKETWRKQIINLVANVPMQVTFKDTVPTVVIINNKSLTNSVFVGDSFSVSVSKFMKSIIAGGTQSVVSPQGYNELYLMCQSSTEVVIESGVDNEISSADIPQSQTTIIQNFQGMQTVEISNPLPAGDNNIGNVDIVSLPANAQLSANTPAIKNLTLTNANTEYSYTLPANTKRFTVSVQDYDGTAILSIYFTAGATDVFKIAGDMGYSEEGLNTNRTLYFKSTIAGKVAQIVSWS